MFAAAGVVLIYSVECTKCRNFGSNIAGILESHKKVNTRGCDILRTAAAVYAAAGCYERISTANKRWVVRIDLTGTSKHIREQLTAVAKHTVVRLL